MERGDRERCTGARRGAARLYCERDAVGSKLYGARSTACQAAWLTSRSGRHFRTGALKEEERERKRDVEREGERDRERDVEREGESERDREREIESERERERERERAREGKGGDRREVRCSPQTSPPSC